MSTMIESRSPCLSLSASPNSFSPTTLLDYLETHLGLLAPPVSRLERVAALLAELREHPTDYPSFRESFAVAPLAVTRRLLDWLETLSLQGWNGSANGGAASRVRQLSLLAHRLAKQPGASVGQRLAAVRSALDQGFSVPIHSLTLTDDLEDWPEAWQRVLKHFTLSQATYTSQATGTTDLGLMQATLQSGSIEISKDGLPWNDDGSVKLLTYDSALSGALWLSRRTTTLGESDRLIVQAGGSLWAESLREHGSPEAAAREPDAFRPVDQLLPLVLRLYREPLDLEALMAFLTHPQCPLEVGRKPLAKALAAEPGMGGEEWKKALTKLSEKDPDAVNLVGRWIPEKRYGEAGLPRTVASETTRRLASRVPRATPQTSLFEAVLTLLGPGYETVPWPILEELATLASPGSADHPLNRDDAGSLAWTDDPGAIHEPCGTLVWFAPARPEAVEPWPWSLAEQRAFSEQGCVFPPVARLSSRALRMVRRAVSQVKAQLVVVVSTDDPTPAPLTVALETFWPKVSRDSLEQSVLNRDGDAPLIALPLPPVKRWWQLPLDLSSLAESLSSHSQLETFLFSPARWLLKTKAEIYPGTVLQVAEASAIQGSFSHWVVEQLFISFGDEALDLDEGAFEEWFQTTFERGLRQMAATAYEAGKGQERLRFRTWLGPSIRGLCRALKHAGARNIRTETKLEGRLFGGYFQGYADILFDGPSGTKGIVDMKSSRSRSWFPDKFSDDTDVQLTLYAELVHQTMGVLPETAYWLLPLELLAARNEYAFPGAQNSSSGTPHAARFRMVETSVAWRRNDLASGRLEVVCEATAELSDPGLAPPGGLPIPEPSDLFDGYTTLYGWEPQS